MHSVITECAPIAIQSTGTAAASSDNESYHPDREAEDVLAVIESIGGPVDVFAHSSGAVVGLAAMHMAPQLIRRAVLYEPPIDVEKSSEAYWKDHAEMAAMAAEGRSGDMMAAFMTGVGMPTT